MEYMRWAKLHPRVRHELTGSGLEAVEPQDLGLEVDHVRLDPHPHYYGSPPLLDAIAKRYNVTPDRVLLTAGSSLANFLLLAAGARSGGGVALEQPCYDPLARAAGLLGLKVQPVPRRPTAGFQVDRAELETHLAHGVKSVLLTNLHNPSGQFIPREVMIDLAGLCRGYGATLIVDEVYLDALHLTQGAPLWTASHLGEHVATTNSLTKVYGLGGIRVGWIIAAPTLIERLKSVMDAVNPCNSAPSQSIGLHAFECIDVLEAKFRAAYAAGRQVYTEWLAREQRVVGYPSFGALFECVRLPRGVSSGALNDLLVSEYDTQVVPGAFFGLDDHVRVSLAPASELLREGLKRLSAALDRLVS